MIPRRLAHLLLFLCAAGLPGCAASGPDAVMLSSGRVPASYEHGLIYLEMRVNGRPGVLFLLDTGASASAIDLAAAERLGLSIRGSAQVEGTAGTIEVQMAEVASLAAGEAEVRDLVFPAYDLGGLLAPAGRRVEGILGFDFLRHFAVEIDFERGQVTFATGDASGVERPGAVVVPFRLDNGIPRFAATLGDGVETQLRLDTGASLFETDDIYLNIPQRDWARLRAANPSLEPERHFTGSGVGGEVRLPVARIEGLAIGPIRREHAYVIVQPQQGYFARPDAVGFVSNNLLEKFGPVTIDYPRRTLLLAAP